MIVALLVPIFASMMSRANVVCVMLIALGLNETMYEPAISFPGSERCGESGRAPYKRKSIPTYSQTTSHPNVKIVLVNHQRD